MIARSTFETAQMCLFKRLSPRGCRFFNCGRFLWRSGVGDGIKTQRHVCAPTSLIGRRVDGGYDVVGWLWQRRSAGIDRGWIDGRAAVLSQIEQP